MPFRRLVADRLWMSAVGVALVLVLAVGYLFANVLEAPLTEEPVSVELELDQTGGLFDGSAVTYRGVKVGKVTDVVPRRGGGVTASLRLAAGTSIPADSRAQVRSLSPVGEQYVDFQPTSSGGALLQSGDTVAAEATDIPASLSSTVIAVNELMSQIDDKSLRNLLTELSAGLSGTGEDIGRLVDQTESLIAMLQRVWPETERLIDNSGTVLDIGPSNAGSLRELASSSRQFAKFLEDETPEVEDLLENTPKDVARLETAIGDAEEYLPDFLAAGAGFTGIFSRWDPHFRELMKQYAPGVGSLSDTFSGGALNVEIFLTRTERCDYPQTERTTGTETGVPFQTDGRCGAGFGRMQRGASHAPGPVR